MSLSKRINGTVDKRPEEYSGEQENIIRQLKLLSRSQTALLKAYLGEKISQASLLVSKSATYLEGKSQDAKATEIRNGLRALKLDELEVDIESTKLELSQELLQLRAAIANGGSLSEASPAAAPQAVAVPAAAVPAAAAPAAVTTEKSAEDAEYLKALESDNAKLRELLRGAQKELSTKSAAADSNGAASNSLKVEIDALKVKLNEANDSLKSKDTEISKSNQQLNDLRKSMSDGSSLEKSLRDDLDKCKKQLKEKEKQLSEKEKQIKTLTNDYEQKLTATKEECSVKMQDLETQWNTEREEMEVALAQELEEVESKKEEEKMVIEQENQKLQKKLKSFQQNNSQLNSKLQSLSKVLQGYKNDYQSLTVSTKRDLADMSQELKNTLGTGMLMKLRTVNDSMKNLQQKYRFEVQERKKLHNMIQELKGNIRVYMRCRPPTTKELESFGNEASCVTFPGNNEVRVFNNEKNREKSWEFDEVFDTNTAQDQVYREVSGLVTSVLDGFNVCIFAYGQTGSGKTFTMAGPPDNRGVNTRALEDLFNRTRERAGDYTDTITVSILEVYNEEIRDLLTDKMAEKLEVKMGEHGNFVPGLTHVPVNSIDAVLQLMTIADRNRASSTTNMNEHSSRSHMMLTVNVVSEFHPSRTISRGKLNLVDLAGSERINKSGAQGQALKEAQNINKSLSALGDVIAARASKQGHIPFRNSTLTFLLQDSLSQDSKTLMFVCVSPVLYNAEETFCSLNFAARVRTVELGKVTKNVSSAGTGGGGSASSVSASTKSSSSVPVGGPSASARRSSIMR